MTLQINGVSKRFGGLKAVHEVTTSIGNCTIHSIIGPNGAGKTTLFNLVTGALAPDAGKVYFDGKDITGWAPNRLAGIGIARTFQRTSIFKDLSVQENVALAVRSRRGMNQSILRSASLEAEISDEVYAILDNVGLMGRATMKAGALAHGIQRALDIAIGLALKPRIVLMDEPLAGMSRGDRETVAGIIIKLKEDLGLTVVVVEHDVGMVMRLSDTITVMQHGMIIAEGTPAAIRENEAVKNAYLHGSFAA
ncbi:ABC transporter ATP-binding protein [Hoeflea sp. G2-23]|uniref:ABC transporter ATP-binding protein n=1 Tax=Hoeflea algicola TaxID=2983763 RepID=A0ABT3ZCV6_9HYPH|nr:ABC transporter ATP-binding protein [Hoeflea algicola]MCY0149632.1 ABC transporter ATP-binding protein [Hoeflea algicola]